MVTMIKTRCPWTMSGTRTRRCILVTTLVSQSSLRGCVYARIMFDDYFRTSHCGRDLLWYNHVCEIAVDQVPHEGEGCPIRYCVPRCSLCKPHYFPLGARAITDSESHRSSQDTGTSYRPGARFGPAGIRAGSRRLTLYGGYNVPLQVNPFLSGLRIVDCGDIPVTPYDNAYAIQQIEDGHRELLHRTPFSALPNDSLTGTPLVPIAKDGKHHPRVITLGGDHTIVLPLLRSIHSAYGPISVIHFDSHLDTWKPSVFGGAPSERAAINHGTYFYWASREGLIANGSSIASIRFPIRQPPFSPQSSHAICWDPSDELFIARCNPHDTLWPGGLFERR